MLNLAPRLRIFVAREPIDFRKGFDGLAGIAREDLKLDPFDGHVFVFLNKRRDRIKLLVWDSNGFLLCYKRLERGTFQALGEIHSADSRLELSRSELNALLDGIDLKYLKRRDHFHERVRIGARRSDGSEQHSSAGG
jgi:transposase